MIRLLSILILCVLSVRVALGSVNVTNYGAWPDCLTLTNLTITSNSVTITMTGNATNSAGARQFQAGDLGKLIEILAGGYYTGTSNCTFIGYITNVVSPTSVKVACSNGVLNNTIQATGSGFLGYFGSDSAPGFASAIAAAAVPTDTIYVPANLLGNTYLMAPRQAITGYPGGIGHKASVYIERGGLTFVGQSYNYSGGSTDVLNGLIARYQFNGNMSDSSGNGFNITNQLASPTYVAGKNSQQALSLDGNSQYAGVGITNDAALTYTCWVNPTSLTPAYAAIVDKDGLEYAEFLVTSAGKLAVYLTTSGGYPNYDGTGTHTLSTGTWYFLSVTYSQSDGIVGYVNDQLMARTHHSARC